MIKARLAILTLVALLCGSHASAKTVYVHLLDGNDSTADGTYNRPFKSWRVALQHVTSGDTIVAKNGDYRKAGRDARWGGLDFVLTLADQLEPIDPHPAEAASVGDRFLLHQQRYRSQVRP